MGGKRKRRSLKLPKSKTVEKLDTFFNCPFCNHTFSVRCVIDMKRMFGEAICDVCNERYCTIVHALTEPIDIYSEWIDACETVNRLEDDIHA